MERRSIMFDDVVKQEETFELLEFIRKKKKDFIALFE